MQYRYSQLDRENLAWFCSDDSRASLIRLEIRKGSIRGLRDIQLHFEYPITAISGKNGVGKSTVLACAACAYHNRSDGFKQIGRRYPYWTFSDFFVQSLDEIGPRGVLIAYQFLHNNWRKKEKGLGWQHREKKALGRWNNYEQRMKRNVVFLGIERVVPHNEKSVSKSYRNAFTKGNLQGFEASVRETVGRILGREYDDFFYKHHYKYRLPVVSTKGYMYSGFNMGAGENALFEIFSVVQACPGSLLLVIDEIELGLHEAAQKRFIQELKDICSKRHIQVICTTHSPTILRSLPPEGRLHLDRQGNTLSVYPGVSPEYAATMLAESRNAECDVLVEDEVAEEFVSLACTSEHRQRVQVCAVGSSAAVIRVLASNYKLNKSTEVCAILDGDKRSEAKSLEKTFLKALETIPDEQKAIEWFNERICFLPGKHWPEEWILSSAKGGLKTLAQEFGVTNDNLSEAIDRAKLAGKHKEFTELSTHLGLSVSLIRPRFIKLAIQNSETETEPIRNLLSNRLKA